MMQADFDMVGAAAWARRWQGYPVSEVTRADLEMLPPESAARILVDELTDAELERALACYHADDIAADVLVPIMDRINAAVGQKNDPNYLAHVLRMGFVAASSSAERCVEVMRQVGAVGVAKDGHLKMFVPAEAMDLGEEGMDALARCGVVLFALEELREAGASLIEDTPELRRAIQKISQQVICPPFARSPAFVEVHWMNAVWAVRALANLGPGVVSWVVGTKQLKPQVEGLLSWLLWDAEPEEAMWLGDWADLGYPRVQLSHKLAAALALTDAPAEVKAPWQSFIVAVPDGMFEPYARLLCAVDPDERVEIVGVIHRDGHIQGVAAKSFPEDKKPILVNFVRSICLALHDKPKPNGRHGSVSIPGKKRALRGAVSGALYTVGKPVQIDLRATVDEVWTGKTRKGKSPTVQFLVRGHWRNQAHGPKRSLRKQKWIEPFWKGDPEARVLLRGHGLK